MGKIVPARSGDAATSTNTSRWPYFHALSFLKRTVKPRVSKGPCSKSSDSRDDESSDQLSAEEDTVPEPASTEQEVGSNEREAANTEREVEHEDSDATDIHDITMKKQSESTASKRVRKSSQADLWNAAMINIEKQKLECLKEKYQKPKEEDEDLLFFKVCFHMFEK